MQKLLIGTLFEEEEIQKKSNFYTQEALDAKGKKRFHGAFTGGFSAGYFNTVGSKEGWTPSARFISSKSSRSKVSQSILDYMDEEDIGETIINENLTTRMDFDTHGVKKNEILKGSLGSSFLGLAPSELMVETNNSIGSKILMNLLDNDKSSRRKKETMTTHEKSSSKVYLPIVPGIM